MENPQGSESHEGMEYEDSIIEGSSNNALPSVAKRRRKQSIPTKFSVKKRQIAVKKDSLPAVELSEEEMSSSGMPQSPPRNNRLIDSYFSPKQTGSGMNTPTLGTLPTIPVFPSVAVQPTTQMSHPPVPSFPPMSALPPSTHSSGAHTPNRPTRSNQTDSTGKSGSVSSSVPRTTESRNTNAHGSNSSLSPVIRSSVTTIHTPSVHMHTTVSQGSDSQGYTQPNSSASSSSLSSSSSASSSSRTIQTGLSHTTPANQPSTLTTGILSSEISSVSELAKRLSVSGNGNSTPTAVHSLIYDRDLRIKELTHELENMKSLYQQEVERNKSLCDQCESLKSDRNRLQGERDTYAQQLVSTTNDLSEVRKVSSKSLERWIKECASLQQAEKRSQVNSQNSWLGTVQMQPMGHRMVETWQEGRRYRELRQTIAELTEKRDQLDTERRKRKPRPLPRETNSNQQSGDSGEAGEGVEGDPDISGFDMLVRQEVSKSRLNTIKKQIAEYQEELQSLDIKKELHIRESRRCRDEENSLYCSRPLLGEANRYQIIGLLGKGGFSEVWHAFDLVKYREVAIKIHQLNSSWSDERKHNYIRHALRENDIQTKLSHENIVQQFDSFVLGAMSFATVLEYCPGTDLERALKTVGTFKEAEARSIVMQIVSALMYLNSVDLKVIHYDLKPANILFDAEGRLKISDFGLSKELESDGDSKIALTSQGAGTYWYLPPECFHTSASSPTLISSKVDVWSVGVILYQMLFGVKPFGEDKSQEMLLKENVILNAQVVTFPTKPVVSEACRDFIRKCLERNVNQRASVVDLSVDKFLT